MITADTNEIINPIRWKRMGNNSSNSIMRIWY
jgi:hypothetical protein